MVSIRQRNGPRYDTHKHVDRLDEAVTGSGEGWIFGLGITVETAPNGWPKTTLVFPVEVLVLGDGLRIETSLTPTSRDFHGTADLALFATEMADGLEHTLERWVNGSRTSRRVGFETRNPGEAED